MLECDVTVRRRTAQPLSAFLIKYIRRNAREEEKVQEVSLVGKVQNSDSAVVVVLGGLEHQEPDNTAAGTSTYVFKPQLNQWLAFQPLPEPRNYHAVVYYDGCIYVLGGYNPVDASKGGQARAQRSVFRFHVREKRWDQAADMLDARASHGATVVYEKIMVVGGKDDKGEILNSVELYNPASDSWVPYRHLPLPLMAVACCPPCTPRTPTSGTWVRRPSLPEPRAYCTALTIHHELWLAGGLKHSGRDSDGFTDVVDVLAFDSLRGRWEFRFKLPRPRHAVAAASADDRVYVIGGMTCLEGTSVEDVDVYHRQRLNFLDCQCLPKKLTGLAAVTVPPDATSGSGHKQADKDRSTEEIEVPLEVRIKSTLRPRPRTRW
ncbi:hypothetical protein HPB52_000319 [Rhipicephalus sanguineus]|uniref:Attractin/MKLN-like beta-propeller domain-containing protein n=1 Tax=Rhipicephalus sanguineus TaxID=34632 RepID=A0A9D4SNI3_RHISA|nr:hypothetical protein HPB52_000319 [Rhipicephalus sanguineus]